MTRWRNFHVHHSDLDGLIVDCVEPLRERVTERVERFFWERQAVGGRHLRICLRGGERELAAVSSELVRVVEGWMREHPAPDEPGYSEERAAALLRREGDEVDDDALRYRNNVVLERPYPSRRHAYVSPEAAEMADDFRHDAVPLAARIIRGPDARQLTLLRLYFLQALEVCRGDLPRGSVSYKSHWSGFSVSTPEEVSSRVAETYERNRDEITGALRDVVHLCESDALDADPVLSAWRQILRKYDRRTRASLAGGHHITWQAADLADARRQRESTLAVMNRESPFVRILWSDERFMASLQYEPAFLVPRVLTNLLYTLVSLVGLPAIEKMALCHHAHRAAEQEFGCNLDDLLRENVDRVVARHGQRWSDPAP